MIIFGYQLKDSVTNEKMIINRVSLDKVNYHYSTKKLDFGKFNGIVEEIRKNIDKNELKDYIVKEEESDENANVVNSFVINKIDLQKATKSTMIEYILNRSDKNSLLANRDILEKTKKVDLIDIIKILEE